MSTPTKVRLELGARADAVDFRDAKYQPSLGEVPATLPPERFLEVACPVLDQGLQMACTGYALATVANFLLRSRARTSGRIPEDVSPEMLYAMARRYDEYPGTNHQGSSIRGAVKGWHRHGVCSKRAWDNETCDGTNYGTLGVLTRARSEDAGQRPLGAYFRVQVDDVSALHGALSEVGCLIAVLSTHDGWFDLLPEDQAGAPPNPLLATLRDMAAAAPGKPPIGPEGAKARSVEPRKGLIPYPAPDTLKLGMHAVAVIGYDADGVWIQNSLGPRWGRGGIARLTWDDWLDNAQDAWVLRLGAPIKVGQARAKSTAGQSANRNAAKDYNDIRPHIIPIGVDGRLQEHGTFATTTRDVASILRDEFRMQTEAWQRRRLLFIVSSGIYPVDHTVHKVVELRDVFIAQEVYPILVLWNGGFADRLAGILRAGWQTRQPPPGAQLAADQSDDRIDGSLESLCRRMGGWVEWEHVKRMAERTVQKKGAMAETLAQLSRAFAFSEADHWPFDVHLVGESSAAWIIGHMVAEITRAKADGGPERRVASATLCGPACTMAFFKQTILPALDNGRLDRCSLVTLADALEQVDGFAGLYRGSLLWLISSALEEAQRIPPAVTGTPMAGLSRHIEADPEVMAVFQRASPDQPARAEWVSLDRGDFSSGAGQLHGRLLQGSQVHNLLDRVLNANIGVPVPGR
ncbi:MAG: C1 family peptidase [Deltaproteobacteria bacterium]|nr:C1 family peptidase [Deltaproteobacteria bacterium]